MDIPWQDRNILSKLGYVIVTTLGCILGFFVFGFIIYVAGAIILAIFGSALHPLLQPVQSFTKDMPANWWIAPLIGAFLFSQRSFRILFFVVFGGCCSTLILPTLLETANPIGNHSQIPELQSFLIGAGICTIVTALSVFAPRPQARFRKPKAEKQSTNGHAPV